MYLVVCTLSEKASKFNLHLLPRRILGRDADRKIDSTLFFNNVLFSLGLMQWKKQCTESSMRRNFSF